MRQSLMRHPSLTGFVRSWLNFKIMWSVWNEYQLIPEYNRTFDTWTEGWWVANGITTGRIPSWMRCGNHSAAVYGGGTDGELGHADTTSLRQFSYSG